MLSTIWLEVLQFSTRADLEAIQLASGWLNAAVAKNNKSLPLRPFAFLRVKGCLQDDHEQTIQYYSALTMETENVSNGTFDNVQRKLSNGYIEQFQIDCFCSESLGLFLASRPGLDRVRFGLFRCVTEFGSDLKECMLAPAIVFAAIQLQPTGYVISWDGSMDGSAPAALSIPLIQNSIGHLVLALTQKWFKEDTSEFLLNFLFSAHQLETCTILSCAKAELLARWLSAFIKRFTSAQDDDHHVSHLCLLRDCGSDDSGETLQSTLSKHDSELGFYPRRAALEQKVLQTFVEPEERQDVIRFSTTGQGRVNRYQSKDGRKSLRLFTWEVQFEQLDEHRPNGIEHNRKAEFAVIEISESA